MKRLKKSDIIKLRQVDHVISENTILADIEHPFLVSYTHNDTLIELGSQLSGSHQSGGTRETISIAFLLLF